MTKNKILIVDDEVLLVEMLKTRLETNGYSVVCAYDGQEGIKIVKTENPDLIILDLMLPKMDGYKVCRMLKFDKRYKNIPIIIFTAKAQDSDKEMSQEVGADAYITKPFDPEILLGKIEELINKAKPMK